MNEKAAQMMTLKVSFSNLHRLVLPTKKMVPHAVSEISIIRVSAGPSLCIGCLLALV